MLTGFRFHRKFEVLPWLKFNISKSGISATIGPDKAHVTVGSHGTWVYADLPGKGTYFRRKLQPMMDDLTDADEDKSDKGEKVETEEKEQLIELGFLDKLFWGPAESYFVDTLKALQVQDMASAYAFAKSAASLADGAFLAGFLAMQHGEWQAALEYFEMALAQQEHLGELFTKVDVRLRVYIPVTEDFMTAIQPIPQDCRLALAIALEQTGNHRMAIEHLQYIRENYDPENLVIRLLLAEIIDKSFGDESGVQHEIVTLAEGVKNKSPIHATLMYYRARALRRMGVIDGARDTLTQAMRKEKGYPSDLLAALRYERALIYEEQGQHERARKEFEKIYAVAPELQDVAERLGLKDKINQSPPQPIHDQTPVDERERANPPIDYELTDGND